MVAAAVEEENGLLALLDSRVQSVGQKRTERRGQACRRAFAHIGNRHLGQPRFVVAFGQLDECIRTCLRLCVALQRGRRGREQ